MGPFDWALELTVLTSLGVIFGLSITAVRLIHHSLRLQRIIMTQQLIDRDALDKGIAAVADAALGLATVLSALSKDVASVLATLQAKNGKPTIDFTAETTALAAIKQKLDDASSAALAVDASLQGAVPAAPVADAPVAPEHASTPEPAPVAEAPAETAAAPEQDPVVTPAPAPAETAPTTEVAAPQS